MRKQFLQPVLLPGARINKQVLADVFCFQQQPASSKAPCCGIRDAYTGLPGRCRRVQRRRRERGRRGQSRLPCRQPQQRSRRLSAGQRSILQAPPRLRSREHASTAGMLPDEAKQQCRVFAFGTAKGHLAAHVGCLPCFRSASWSAYLKVRGLEGKAFNPAGKLAAAGIGAEHPAFQKPCPPAAGGKVLVGFAHAAAA